MSISQRLENYRTNNRTLFDPSNVRNFREPARGINKYKSQIPLTVSAVSSLLIRTPKTKRSSDHSPGGRGRNDIGTNRLGGLTKFNIKRVTSYSKTHSFDIGYYDNRAIETISNVVFFSPRIYNKLLQTILSSLYCRKGLLVPIFQIFFSFEKFQ